MYAIIYIPLVGYLFSTTFFHLAGYYMTNMLIINVSMLKRIKFFLLEYERKIMNLGLFLE